MCRLILVTGGARSGKSSFGEAKVKAIGHQIGYIATAIITDKDMEERIKHHQASRPSHWPTFECYKNYGMLKENPQFMACDTLILDCVTIAITNCMFDDPRVDYDTCNQEEIQRIEGYVKQELEGLLKVIRETNQNLVIITNEVGLGLVPPYRLGNIFRDIAGRMNQFLAAEADEVYFIVSGLPMTLKG
jgi:adenosylcobinamide kinase/adenosylcobinamide-phosphate guanylyltransferase